MGVGMGNTDISNLNTFLKDLRVVGGSGGWGHDALEIE